MTTLAIPPTILPADGRFGSGPSRIREAQSATLASLGSTLMGTSHRQSPVKNVVGRIREGLSQFFGAPEGYEVILGNGGATFFWDAATFGLIRERSQHAVFGEFSAKFAAAAKRAPFIGEPEVLEAEVGHLAVPAPSANVDAYAWTQNETSTGAVAPVTRVAGEGLMLVDATSAAGGVRVDLAQTDAYYFAPQKAFGSDGGLWFAVVSPAALARIEELSTRWVPDSLSLPKALENSRKNQTLNTPAIATLILMAEQVDWLNDMGGMEAAAARCDASAAILYDWAEASSFASPFVAEAAARSSVVGTIEFDAAISAADVCAALRNNGVVDVEPYRKLGRNQIRVGMYPSVDPEDVRALTACVDYVVEHLAD